MFITLCNPSNLGSWNWIYIENHSNALFIVSIQIYHIYIYIYIFGEEYSKLFDSPKMKHPPNAQNQPIYKRYESCAFVNGNIK